MGSDAAHKLLIEAIELRAQNQISECRACLHEALALDPHSARARYELSCVQLLTGNYREGFAGYGSRWEAAGLQRPMHTDGALLGEEWRGADPAGKRILLHAEQGFGDTIQFIRFAAKVAGMGADILVEVQPELRELAACMLSAKAVGTGLPTGFFDYHSSLMDLPLAFRTNPGTIPPPVRINVPEATRQLWAKRIPGDSKMKISLVWAGNPRNSIDGRRSIQLDRLTPIFDAFADAEFFSFQMGAAAEQLRRYTTRMADLRPHLRGFVDTAAALLRMDRVITVDTAVAHLAASLGLDVWLLLQFSPCWRWLLNSSISPWYPSMKIFRQPSPGNWEGVISQVCNC